MPSTPIGTSVGFIGLGRMGAGMARNLLASGVRLTVYDARPAAAETLGQQGATIAGSPAEVAGDADLVFLCLPFAPEVREALFGPRGVASAARAALHVVDTTTLYQRDAVAFGAEAAAAGFGYSDCPISGMPLRADDGTLTMMFGGTSGELERARPHLDAMGTTIVHCGSLGSGQLMKAINNIVYDINIVGLCEVLPLAIKAGLDVEQVAAVVTSGTSRSFASDYFVPRILDGAFDTDFAMGDAHKDIVNIQHAKTRHGASTPLIDAMTESYERAMAEGYAAEPKSAIIKIYERSLGVEFRHPPSS